MPLGPGWTIDRHLRASSWICLTEALCAAGQLDVAIREATAAVVPGTGEHRIDIGAAGIVTAARVSRGEPDGVIEDNCARWHTATASYALALMREARMSALERRAPLELAGTRPTPEPTPRRESPKSYAVPTKLPRTASGHEV